MLNNRVIRSDWLRAPSHLGPLCALTLFKHVFGYLHAGDVSRISRCKTSHFKTVCLHPVICSKWSYPASHARASWAGCKQQTNQVDSVYGELDRENSWRHTIWRGVSLRVVKYNRKYTYGEKYGRNGWSWPTYSSSPTIPPIQLHLYTITPLINMYLSFFEILKIHIMFVVREYILLLSCHRA